MSEWTVQNSLKKTIFETELSLIESWNDVLYLYSKITNNSEIYKDNYLFFTTSTNAPFSRDEILNCLEMAFNTLNNDEFSESLAAEDKRDYYDLFWELKSNILRDPSDTFSTSVTYLD